MDQALTISTTGIDSANLGIGVGIGIIRSIFYLAVILFSIISSRKVFEKAGYPGRGIFIPFYNIYLLFKIGGKSGKQLWWILFPPVLIVLIIILNFDIAKRFNKSGLFGLGLLLCNPVFMGILAFDKSITYTPIEQKPIQN